MRKVIGAVFIIISGALFAFFRVLKEKTKLKNLKEVQKALFQIKQEIAFSGKILPRIIYEISSCTEGEVGEFFGAFGEELKKDEKTQVPEAFFKAKAEKMLFPGEAESVVADFFKSVGTFSGDLEEMHIDAALKKLARIEKEEEKRFRENKKLSFTLGICASFSVVMLLI